MRRHNWSPMGHIGLYKNPVSFYKWSKITWSLFFFTLIVFSGGELPVDKKCEFSSFLWVWKHPWSRVNGCNLLFSFPSIAFHFELLSCSFHFALIAFHVALMSFHFPFMSFHVPSLCIEDTSPRKLTCSNRSCGYPPKRSRCFHISLSLFVIV
jgi:hypothetical protein